MNYRVWFALGLAVLAGVLGLLYPFLSILVYSVFIYYIARQVYSRLLPKLRSESLCAFVSIFALVLPVVVVVLYTVGVASIEMKNVVESSDIEALKSSSAIIDEASRIASEVKLEEILDLFAGGGSLTTKVLGFLSGQLGSLVWNIISSTFSIIFKLFLTFIISFYLLVDGGKLRIWIKTTFFPADSTADTFFDELDKELSSVFSGNILTAGVIAVLGSLMFTIVNNISTTITIPYPVLLGILCGLASLIPVVGVALIWIPLSAYLVLNAVVRGVIMEHIIPIGLFVIATYVFVDSLPNMLLRPRISGRRLHKGLLLLSYIFGPIVFGFMGLFLGPMILVFAVNFSRIALPKLVRS